MDTPLIAALTAAVLGPAGVIAWFKLGPERRKLTIDVAQGAVIVQSSVLKDLQGEYIRVSGELAQLQVESKEREAQLETEQNTCQRKIDRLELRIESIQLDLERQSRMTELARKKSHAAINCFGSCVLLADNLVGELRERGAKITEEMRTRRIRETFQQKMDEIEALEGEIISDTIRPVAAANGL